MKRSTHGIDSRNGETEVLPQRVGSRVLVHRGELPRWGTTRWLYLQSQLLRENLHDVLRPLVATEDDYKEAFDDLEYRIGFLQHVQQTPTNAYRPAPGEFIGEWRWSSNDGPQAEAVFRRAARDAHPDWPWWALIGQAVDLDLRLTEYREALAQMRRFG